ncbi:hypothetical protein [Dactylosporangium sp. CA-233914]
MTRYLIRTVVAVAAALPLVAAVAAADDQAVADRRIIVYSTTS